MQIAEDREAMNDLVNLVIWATTLLNPNVNRGQFISDNP
jgi:hypothetical protein